jgi:dsDNA-specific endonuclease/ATPase MutS2
VKLEITDVLDLHTFAPRDVKDVVEAYLEEAHAAGFRQVRIIHGKGIGVQRELVRAILRRTSFVVHYEEALPAAGSWGATVAWLGAAAPTTDPSEDHAKP